VNSTSTKRINRYKGVSAAKAEGVTYTPENLANFVAAQISKHLPADLSTPLKVLDPAMGEGALLISLLHELGRRGIERLDVYGFETDTATLAKAASRLHSLFPKAQFHFSSESFLDFVGNGSATQKNLFRTSPQVMFDLIIANPPYVRTQILGSNLAQDMARRYQLTGRIDLYYAFILAIGCVLEKNGTAGIIVSNRFMTTKSGGSVRNAILKSLRLKHIWDLGDTKLFDAAVLPAVLVVQPRDNDSSSSKPNFTSIYETSDIPVVCVNDPIDALRHVGTVSTKDGRSFRVEHGILNSQAGTGEVWSVTTDASKTWLSTVQAHTWGTFHDIGEVRVGIKTCGDKVFIRSDWSELPQDQQPELLLPLTTHHIARRFKPDMQQAIRKVLYPHTVRSGKRTAVDLDLYPRTKAYLWSNREFLAGRRYVAEAGRQWYEIWVPQDPESWAAPKLVFRDISETPTFWIDQEKTVVNGDCYWLKARSKAEEELLWLALAISNSSFIEAFYDLSFNNKLYARRRRFITQYVENFPLPDPNGKISKELVKLSKLIYKLTPSAEATSCYEKLDDLVWKAFGVQSKKSRGNGI
jgi:Type I restriction-modification system methyltransferase subunit